MEQKENTSAILRDYFKRYGATKHFAAGEQLFYKGEQADTIYYLIRGRVRAYFLYPDGTEKTLCFVEGDNLVGEEVASMPPERIVCADAAADCYMLAVSRETVLSSIRTEPEAFAVLLGFFMKKIEVLSSWIFYAQFRQNRAKLACFLYTSTEKRNEVTYTQQQIADVTGMSRMSVSKCLRQLEKQGLAESGYGCIRVLNRAALRDHFGEMEFH